MHCRQERDQLFLTSRGGWLADLAMRMPGKPSMWSACLCDTHTASSLSTCTTALSPGQVQRASHQASADSSFLHMHTTRADIYTLPCLRDLRCPVCASLRFSQESVRSGQADLLLSQGSAVVPDELPVHALSGINEHAAPAVQAHVDAAGAAVLAGLRAARPQEQQAPAVALQRLSDALLLPKALIVLQRLSHVVLPPGVLLGPFCYGMSCCGLSGAACSLAAVWALLPEGRLPTSRWRGEPLPFCCMAALGVSGRRAVQAGCLLRRVARGGSTAVVKAHAAVRVPWPGECCALDAFHCSAELRALSQGYRPPWATCSAGRARGPCCGADHA